MPRKRYSFGRRTRARSQSAPAVPSKPLNRPSRRKLWTNEQMLAALKAVELGQPINQAARDHGIPKTTLKDRVSGRVVHGVRPGPSWSNLGPDHCCKHLAGVVGLMMILLLCKKLNHVAMVYGDVKTQKIMQNSRKHGCEVEMNSRSLHYLCTGS